jgi:O-6-methylguanine DNA methyltransferase
VWWSSRQALPPRSFLGKANDMSKSISIRTSEGLFTAFFSERGLARLDFPGPRGQATRADRNGASDSLQQRRWQKLTTRALERALAGRRPGALPPLDWAGHTGFQQQVWRALLGLRPGETKTYAQIAAELGKPLAARATGGACGANPIPVLVPCHRVLAANGRLGGFSGGLDWKRRLLAREGVSAK